MFMTLSDSFLKSCAKKLKIIQQFCMYTLFLKFFKKLPLGWLKAGWEHPCFFNIFKQDLSKIEFEYYILDQHKKCFKMRPNKTMLAITLFWPKFAPSGVRRGGGTLPVAGLEPLPQLFLCDFYHPRDQSQLLRGETCKSISNIPP